MAPEFAAAGLAARELQAAELPALQAFLDANPAYWLTVNGRPPPPDLARIEFDERPPPHLGWTRRWFLGVFDAASALQGLVEVVSDLGAPGVWHLGLFLLASDRHGRGDAQALHTALLAWAAAQGARWMRLGVVAGNARAERFWAGQGYAETRVREGVDTGGRVNTLRVMVRALHGTQADAGTDLAAYRALVPRDMPGSSLP